MIEQLLVGGLQRAYQLLPREFSLLRKIRDTHYLGFSPVFSGSQLKLSSSHIVACEWSLK